MEPSCSALSGCASLVLADCKLCTSMQSAHSVAEKKKRFSYSLFLKSKQNVEKQLCEVFAAMRMESNEQSDWPAFDLPWIKRKTSGVRHHVVGDLLPESHLSECEEDHSSCWGSVDKLSTAGFHCWPPVWL